MRLCGDEIKFRLKDREFAEECEGHADTCGEWVRSNTKMMSGEFLRRPKGFLNYYRILFASSTPVYLLAKFQNVKNTTMVNSDKGDIIMKVIYSFNVKLLILLIVKLRQGSGKDWQGMAVKAKGLKA